MIWLFLSILASSLISLVFVAIGSKDLKTIQVIVINYFVCFFLGSLLWYSDNVFITKAWNEEWFKYAFLLGFLFIFIFNLMAKVAQKSGVAVQIVVTKMSVVIPIIYGIVILNETLTFKLIIGVVLSLVAIIVMNLRGVHNIKQSLLLSLLVFLGSGIIDISISYIKTHYFSSGIGMHQPSTAIFLFAGLVGFVYLIISKNIKSFFEPKNLLFGILLGVPNFFSIYFLFKSLASPLNVSLIFAINNIGIVVLSSVLAIILLKSYPQRNGYLGLLFAIVALVLLSL